MGEKRYHCGDCDDWKPRAICPDCGTRCTIYVVTRRVRPHPTPPENDDGR